jgi:hypothetical protein
VGVGVVQVDLEAIDRHEYLINPAFSPELERLSKEKKQIMKEIEALVEAVRTPVAEAELELTL